MKKIVALALAAVMALALVGAAFAEPAAASEWEGDTQVTVAGLDTGDVVSLYQILVWNNGWELAPAFSTLDNDSVNAIIANTSSTITRDDVEAITEFVKTKKIAATVSDDAEGTSFTADVDPGMYLALVAPVKDDVLYNPMIVSADTNTTAAGNTNIIDASNATLGTVAKKETVTLEKEHSDITFNAGDYVQFTVTTTIPVWADSYAPEFTVTDTLSDGLKFAVDTTDHKFEVSCGSVHYTGGPEDDGTTYTIVFNSEDLENLESAQAVTITYWAQITDDCPHNVNEMNNTVEVKFNNNPGDDSSHGHLKDKTVEYVFDIDAAVNGNESYTTGEIVKVGVDPNGNVILESKTLSNGSKHAALPEAVFGVYSTQTDAEAGNTNYYKNDQFEGTVESDANGLLNIKGLKAGTYFIKELSAPAGYIKDSNTYSFTITAQTEKVTEEETLDDGCKVKYDYWALKGYTVTFNGTSSTYTWTNEGPKVSSVVVNDSSSEIVNTRGLELPSTGGIGTTIFYVAGLVMILGAGAILVARRRADAE